MASSFLLSIKAVELLFMWLILNISFYQILHHLVWLVLQKTPDMWCVSRFRYTYGGVLILVNLQAQACNFTKINTPPRVFFTFFKFYKWCQIVKRTRYCSYIHFPLAIWPTKDLLTGEKFFFIFLFTAINSNFNFSCCMYQLLTVIV